VKTIVSTIVAAPLEQVWAAYTTPDDIVIWNTASPDWHTTSSESSRLSNAQVRPNPSFKCHAVGRRSAQTLCATAVASVSVMVLKHLKSATFPIAISALLVLIGCYLLAKAIGLPMQLVPEEPSVDVTTSLESPLKEAEAGHVI
jgi:hypothetical protein